MHAGKIITAITIFLVGCNSSGTATDTRILSTPSIVILGIAQDGGDDVAASLAVSLRNEYHAIAFVSVHSTSFGSSIPNDLYVGDHVRHHFPTRSGSIDRSQPNKSQATSQGNSQFHKQKCLKGIDTLRPPLLLRLAREPSWNHGSRVRVFSGRAAV